PDRQDVTVLAERPVPRERMVVVGVDERAVDVEDGDQCDRLPCTSRASGSANQNQAKLTPTRPATMAAVVPPKITSQTSASASVIAKARNTTPAIRNRLATLIRCGLSRCSNRMRWYGVGAMKQIVEAVAQRIAARNTSFWVGV